MFHGGSFKNDRNIKDIPAILTQYLLSDQQENEKEKLFGSLRAVPLMEFQNAFYIWKLNHYC